MGEDVINSTDSIQKLDGACGPVFLLKNTSFNYYSVI
jgi:hypothetical protein